MSSSTRYAKKQAKARQRHRLQAQERLERDRRQAQRAAEALHQALEGLALPATLVVAGAGRLRSPQKLRGTPSWGACARRSLGAAPLRRSVACAAGISKGHRAFWERCPSAPG
jgi:hypothetical protein